MCRPNSSLFIVSIKFLMLVLPMIFWTGFVTAQSISKLKQSCAKYHEERVLFLLHCCGDVQKIVYPGPRFLGDMGDKRRAELALGEIKVAMKTCNKDKPDRAYLSLQLDAAGANLMEARSIAVENSHEWIEAGSSASRATAALKRFYLDHPSEAASVWKVIEYWLYESGGPWQALEFVNSLPTECCSKAELARVRGDLFVEVELRALAAQSYSEWIKIVSTPPTCGNEHSLSNVEILRRAGFDLPEFKAAKEAACSNTGFGYYVILPAKSVAGRNNPVVPTPTMH